MNKLQIFITSLLVSISSIFIVSVFLPNYAGAVQDPGNGSSSSSSSSNKSSSGSSSGPAGQILSGVDSAGGKGTKNDDFNSSLKNITNILMFVVGAVAVIMIIVGGIRYTTSNGDSSNVKSAKDTILYSVIGLVVALLAYAVVNWVVDRFV